MNRSAGSIICCLSLLVLAGCDNLAAQAPGPRRDLKKIEALNLSYVSSPGQPPTRTISGRFEIRAPRYGESYITSNGIGGACLLAQVSVSSQTCTRDHECDITQTPSGNTWIGYCLNQQCWVKPSDNYCLVAQLEGLHSISPTDPAEVYTYLANQPGGAQPVNWAVFACLNGNAGRTCGGIPGTMMTDLGEPMAVP